MTRYEATWLHWKTSGAEWISAFPERDTQRWADLLDPEPWRADA